MSGRSLAAGTILAQRYEVSELLGTGGFGTTYRARDVARFGEACVVKELLSSRTASDTARRLFEREARLLCELSHPRIPRLHAYFEERGRFFLVQDFVDGETLGARLKRESRLAEGTVRDIVLNLLDVLEYLHHRVPPVIHRDIKPANIICGTHGEIYLIDFGAVREAIESANGEQPTIIGTRGYTPVEQARGHPTPASDLYALGATALHLISGVPPDDWHDRVSGKLAWRGQVECSAGFADVIDRLLADLPQRYQTAAEVRQALLGGATVLGDGAVVADGAGAGHAARDPSSPARGARGASSDANAPSDSRASSGRSVVPPPPRRSRALRYTAIAAGVVGIAVVAAVLRDGTPAGTSTGTEPAQELAPAPANVASLPPGDARPVEGDRCAERRIRTFRTESQFDLHILCPATWSAMRSDRARATRIMADGAGTQVWASIWLPARADEDIEAFVRRWRTTMEETLGPLELRLDATPDNETARYRVLGERYLQAAPGSLQVERTTLNGNRYMVWSLLIGTTESTRPTALEVLTSIEYLTPSANGTGS